MTFIPQEASGGNVFVYREGGTPSSNVYPSFNAALTALTATQGATILEFDNSLGSPNIPAGTYAIPVGTKFYAPLNANGGAAPVQVNCADGVIWSTPPTDLENVQLLMNNTSAPNCLITGDVAVTMRNAKFVANGNTEPAFAATGSAALEILEYDQSGFEPSGGGPLVTATGGSVFVGFTLLGNSTLPDTMIGGGSGAFVSVDYDASSVVAPTQSLFSGTYITTLLSSASGSPLATLGATFSQPAPGATVGATVSTIANMFVGQGVTVPGGGFYVVQGLSGTTALLLNTGAFVNAPTGDNIGTSGTVVYEGTQEEPFTVGQISVDGPISFPGAANTGLTAGLPLVASKGDQPNALTSNGSTLIAAGNDALFLFDPVAGTYETLIIRDPTTGDPSPIPSSQTPRWACYASPNVWIFSDDGTDSYVTVVNASTGTITYANFNIGAFLIMGAVYVAVDGEIWATTSTAQLWGFPISASPASGGPFHTLSGMTLQQGGLCYDGSPTGGGTQPNVYVIGYDATGSGGAGLWVWGFNGGSAISAFNSASAFGATPGVTSYGVSAFGTKQLYVLATYLGTSAVWIVDWNGGPSSWTGANVTISTTEIASGIATDLGTGHTVVSVSTQSSGNTNQQSAVQISGGLTPVLGANFTLFPTGAPGPDPGIMPPLGTWLPRLAVAGGGGYFGSVWSEESMFAYAAFFTAPSKQIGFVSSLTYSADLGTSNVKTFGSVTANTVSAQHYRGLVVEVAVVNADVSVASATTKETQVVVTGLTANHQCSALPPTPFIGQELLFIDGDGSMASHTFTVVGTINGTANFVMTGADSVLTIRWTAAAGWRIV